MTFNEIADYFKGLATRHVDILHEEGNGAFVALHASDNADGFIKKLKKTTVCILITPDKKLLPPKSENYNWDKNICFFILKKCAGNGVAAIVSAQNDCEIIADDFVAQIIADRYTAIRSILQESVVIQPVGPMSDDFYGQVCMFSLVDGFNQRVDPARWAVPGP